MSSRSRPDRRNFRAARAGPAAVLLFLLSARSVLAANPASAPSRPAVNYREPERSFQTVYPAHWTVMIEQQ
ncbi:MAG: hypothetical protein ABSE73_02495, partial [Planctomycetota bacterium]